MELKYYKTFSANSFFFIKIAKPVGEFSDTINRSCSKFIQQNKFNFAKGDRMSLKNLKTYLALLIIFTVTTASISSQQILWSSINGGLYNDEAYASVQTSDNGYAVIGSTYSYGSGDYDVFLLRLNERGDTLWTKTYGGSSAEYGRDIIASPDGGFLLVGSTKSGGFGLGDVYLVKTDSLGNTIWIKTYGGGETDNGFSIRMTADLGYVICGTTNSYGYGYGDVYLIKIDSIGVVKWIRTYGGALGDSGAAVRLCNDGGFIIAGATGSFGEGYSSMYAIRTDDKGDTLWTRTYGGENSDFGYSVEPTYDGGFIFGGATSSFGAGYNDAYLVKTDFEGTVMWEKTFGGYKDDKAYSVSTTSDGGYILGGTTQSSGAGKLDMYIVKTDANGDSSWTRTFGGTKSDYCRMVYEDFKFNFILIGYSYSYSAGGADAYVVNVTTDMITAVGDLPELNLPKSFSLKQNYPNPFNATTRIEYDLSRKSNVTLRIYNVLAQVVQEWDYGYQSAGNYSVDWDGYSSNGVSVASGIYFYTLMIDEFHETKKMVLLK